MWICCSIFEIRKNTNWYLYCLTIFRGYLFDSNIIYLNAGFDQKYSKCLNFDLAVSQHFKYDTVMLNHWFCVIFSASFWLFILFTRCRWWFAGCFCFGFFMYFSIFFSLKNIFGTIIFTSWSLIIKLLHRISGQKEGYFTFPPTCLSTALTSS